MRPVDLRGFGRPVRAVSVGSRAAGLCLAALVLLASAGGCGPKYPACKNDDDCNRDTPRGEFCVNQMCQKCRTDKDCKEGETCNKGRCDAVPGFCKDNSACPEGQACVDNKCQGCTGDAQCGDGKCSAGKCVPKNACKADDDCPPDQDCKAGRCQPAAPKKASQEAPCKLQTIYFDFNESVLTTDATQGIDANAACIKQVGRPVEMIGRTDPRGTEEYNLALSERRAQEVKKRLARLGVDDGKMRVLPKGELDAKGADEAGWAQDRRVDFEWM